MFPKRTAPFSCLPNTNTLPERNLGIFPNNSTGCLRDIYVGKFTRYDLFSVWTLCPGKSSKTFFSPTTRRCSNRNGSKSAAYAFQNLNALRTSFEWIFSFFLFRQLLCFWIVPGADEGGRRTLEVTLFVKQYVVRDVPMKCAAPTSVHDARSF